MHDMKNAMMMKLLLAVVAGFGAAGTVDAARKSANPLHKAALDPLLVQVRSTHDGTMQPCYFYVPEAAKTNAVPLLVGLHTWSGDIGQYHHYFGPYQHAKRHGWAMVGSGFRGPNWTPQACGSEAAVQDIVDAIEYAKSNAKIDPDRIYIIGASGGGHMALLMVGRHPEIFAAAAAFCPPADLALWYDQLVTRPSLKPNLHYSKHLLKACGGTPKEKPEEYARRSATTHLERARAAGVAIYIETGIHDGWTGSVPCGQSVRCFNLLADGKDRISKEDIAYMEENQSIPESLRFTGTNPFYNEKRAMLLRRKSANVVLTMHNGGHGGNWSAAYDFLARQKKGQKADFTVPKDGSGMIEKLHK